MACIGNLTDTSHLNFSMELRLNYLCFFLAVFSDSEYLDTPSSEENGFFILLRQPRLIAIINYLLFSA